MSTHRLLRFAPLASFMASAALFLLALPVALHASSITYDVILSPAVGAIGGAGQITLSGAPSAHGKTIYRASDHTLDGLTFTLDGQIFSLAADPTASVEFLNGKLSNISFAETLGSGPNRYTLDTAGGYAFYYDGLQREAAGSFSATPAQSGEIIGSGDPGDSDPVQTPTGTPAATPEPESLVLLGTALCFLAAMVVRRHVRPS